MRISAEFPVPPGILSFAHSAGNEVSSSLFDSLFRRDLADVVSAILRTYRKL
jgi:hypothetical protein